MRVIVGVNVLDRLEEVPGEVSRLRGYGVDVAYDIETTDLDPINSRMVAVQLKAKGKRAAVIDVRHFSPADLRLLGMMLEPLFDGHVVLVGHNLKFDFEFALAQMSLGAHRAYDTMLAEQVIWGLGTSSALRKKVHFGMDDLADRYELDVEKDTQKWFIHLDTRVEGAVLSQVGVREDCTEVSVTEDGEEPGDYYIGGPEGLRLRFECREVPVMEEVGGYRPWDEPFPEQVVRYMRQDVSVVHRIKELQQAAIERDGLQEVLDLEMRALFALVGVEVWGVSINREGWLAVVDRVEEKMHELEHLLHLGSDGPGGHEGLDIHILKVRNEKYMEKWRPYSEWMKAREAFVATRRAEWDGAGGHLITPEGEFTGWGEYKKAMLDWWYERHEKLAKPTTSKSGVNLGSWMQVRDGFNDLGIPVKSVSEETLTPYIGKHPLVQIYIDYSHARKIVTDYGRERGTKDQAFVERLDAHDRLRASYQQIGADTGRMSSYSPNFQQIPADGVGAELRHNVVPAPGYTFVIADFSNIELRIVAELSGDRFLLDAFGSGQDVHAYTAKVMFGLTDEQATKEWTDSHNAVVGGKELVDTSYRKVAKTINYMLLYGAGVKRLAAKMRVSESDSKVLLNLYYTTFATAIGFLNEQKARLDKARKAGESRVYSETRSGRRRWFDIPSVPSHPAHGGRVSVSVLEAWNLAMDGYRGQMASIKRQLANTPIQGLSADITKETVGLWYERVGYDEDMRLVAVVHDELLIEAKPDCADRAGEILAGVMMEAVQKYLRRVDLGEVHPVVTSHWKH